MSSIAANSRLELDPSFANAMLRGAARLWFAVAVLGQWIFAFYVASVYSRSAARGGLAAWNKNLFRGYIPGDAIGNAILVLHLLLAVIMLFGGPLQFSTKIRRDAPAVHRWNGRLYILSVVVCSVGGTYMMWARRTLGDNWQHAGQTLNATLIVTFAALALRSAMAREFRVHRRWALRLFIVANGVWFLRVGDKLWSFIHRGRSVGFDPNTFTGPFPTIWHFADYLLPLLILEVYFIAAERGAARGRLATASLLLIATIAMGIGAYLSAAARWVPMALGWR